MVGRVHKLTGATGGALLVTPAALVIAGFLFVTCYQISLSAFKRVFAHDTLAPGTIALTLGVMIGAIIANIVVTIYEARARRRLAKK
jgi:divalent metal cation (Fe/Co/Zn/Cd) transporter